MNHTYHDIRCLIPREPLWWDERAVPRYCPFAPNEIADIYAYECVLMLIECQACQREFRVCVSLGASEIARLPPARRPKTTPWLDPKMLEYGDPPNVECCPAGPTMSSVPVRVLEFWTRHDHVAGWERVPALEVAIVCSWAEEWTRGRAT